jgi:hypothetical protein
LLSAGKPYGLFSIPFSSALLCEITLLSQKVIPRHEGKFTRVSFLGGTFVSALSDEFGINLAHQRKKMKRADDS